MGKFPKREELVGDESRFSDMAFVRDPFIVNRNGRLHLIPLFGS
jgi:hypothetical protein